MIAALGPLPVREVRAESLQGAINAEATRVLR